MAYLLSPIGLFIKLLNTAKHAVEVATERGESAGGGHLLDFALPAQELARIHDITLINGEELVRLIEEHKLQKLLKDTLYKQDKN